MDLEKIKERITNTETYINGWKRMKRSSVIILLVKIKDETYVLFEVRAKVLNSQPGDICFPGGRIDGDERPKEAAIREICEELGIHNITIVNELDTVVRFDNIIIHPFLGIIEDINEIKLNESEVDHVFYVPLDYLLKHKYLEINSKVVVNRPKDFPYHLIVNGENYKFREAIYRSLFYKFEDYNIWGITAEILNDFLSKL